MAKTTAIRVDCYSLRGNQIETAQAHNLREYDVSNARKDLSHLNEELVREREASSFRGIVNERLKKLRDSGAQNRAVNSNAIGSMEVVIRANGIFLDEDGQPPDDFDANAWAKASLAWAQEYFNPPDGLIHYTDKDGKECSERVNNVYSCVLHMDEATPHIHLMVMPVDEHGHLNSHAYRSLPTFKGMQDSYYTAVGQHFGLERGRAYSPAKAESIRQYYRHIDEAMAAESPVRIPGELPQQYEARVDHAIKGCHAHIRAAEVENERKLNQTKASVRQAYKLIGDMSRALGGDGSANIDMDWIRQLASDARQHAELNAALAAFPNTALAASIQRQLSVVLSWYREKERQARKNNEDRAI